MRRTLSAVLALSLLATTSLSGCGDTKSIHGVTYDTYGFLNEGEKRNPDVEYELIVGNVIWGIILVETIIAPIYFFGFSLYQPVGAKGEVVKGQVH